MTQDHQSIPERYQIGTVADAEVVGLQPYGAFVEFEPRVIGLLLVPETLAGQGQLPKDVLRIGDTVRVKVLRIDESRTKMSVSQKALLNPEP